MAQAPPGRCQTDNESCSEACIAEAGAGVGTLTGEARQGAPLTNAITGCTPAGLAIQIGNWRQLLKSRMLKGCLLYTSDAADDTPCVDL
eukprot:1004846-Pyramimonas_sp.AAC.1